MSSETVQHRLPTIGPETPVIRPMSWPERDGREGLDLGLTRRNPRPRHGEQADPETVPLDSSSGLTWGQMEDIVTQIQELYKSARDLESETTRVVEVYHNNPDLAPLTPDADRIAEVQRIRAVINDLETRLVTTASGSASRRIDQVLLHIATADMSRDAQYSRINACMNDRRTLLNVIETRFAPDLDERDVLPPPENIVEYLRVNAEYNILFDRLMDLDRMEYPPEDETPDRVAIATAFLAGLPVVPLDELAEDGDCNICMEPYVTGCESDVVRLPCGHLFGSQCLSSWLSTAAATCPMCRVVLFEVHTEPYFTGPHFTFLDLDPTNDDGEYVPRPGRLAEWRGAWDFVDYIGKLSWLVIREGAQHSEQPLLFLDTFAGPFEARGARIAGTPAPDEQSFAEIVLGMSKLFFTAGERDEEVAAHLATLMGRLYESLREPIQMAGCPIVWTENGPPPSFLIDPAGIPLVETALERLVQIESEDLTRRTMAV